MNSTTSSLPLPFDHVEAHAHLSRVDKHLARVIAQVGGFRFKLESAIACTNRARSDHAPEHRRQSRAGDLRSHQSSRRKRQLPDARRMLRVPKVKLRKAGLSAKVAAVKIRAENNRRSCAHHRRRGKNVRSGTRRPVDFGARYRPVDRGDVPNLSAGPSGHSPNPRLRGAKGLRDHLSQKKNPQAERASEVRRTLDGLPDRRELVHVARGAACGTVCPQDYEEWQGNQETRRREQARDPKAVSDFSRIARNSAIRPATSTLPSISTDAVCKRSN